MYTPREISRLEDEYKQLREDERQWGGRAVSLGSFYVVGVGTIAFFFLGQPPPQLPHLVAMLTPVPAFGITALIIRQAITASARGTLLLAYEQELYRAIAPIERRSIRLSTGHKVPLGSSYHAQQRWLRGRIGRQLTWFERAGLSLVVAVCYFSINALPRGTWTNVAIALDGLAAMWLFLLAVDGFGTPKVLAPQRERLGRSIEATAQGVTGWPVGGDAKQKRLRDRAD